jgi:hypothetical protein
MYASAFYLFSGLSDCFLLANLAFVLAHMAHCNGARRKKVHLNGARSSAVHIIG